MSSKNNQSGYGQHQTMAELGKKVKRRQLHPAVKAVLLFVTVAVNLFLALYSSGAWEVQVQAGKAALDNMDSFVTSFATIFLFVLPGAIAFSWYFLEAE